MSGTSSGDYAVEYTVRQRLRRGPRGYYEEPRKLGCIIVLLVLGLSYVVLQVIDLPFWPRGTSNSVIAQGGCFDIIVEPVDHDPSMALDEVESNVREQVIDRGIATEISADEHGETDLDSVRWAQYGIIAREISQSRQGFSRHGTVRSEQPRWVLIFEEERDQRWWSQLWQGSPGPRLTVIYDPDEQRIGNYCVGQTPEEMD